VRLARILDVGCGPAKYPGSIGLDMNPNTAADVLCHLDKGGLPFRDNSFDQVRAEHFIEHVADVIATMEEFHRVTRPGGTIFILTPHYTDCNSFTDPTHRSHLNTYSFHYFYPGGRHGKEMWYTNVRVRELRLRVKLLRLWRTLGFEFLLNHNRILRQFWEQYLSFLIRGKLIEFTFEVIK
jgi:predicted SAM-dependent methyltransferase